VSTNEMSRADGAASPGQLLQIGAGNIGRGYMAQLFHEAGYRVVFADAVESIVSALNASGRYPLRVLDAYAGAAREMEIGPVRAVMIQDQAAFTEEVVAADVLSTAVGVPNLPRLAPALAEALLARRARGAGGVDIFLCENTLTAGRDLKAAVLAAVAAGGDGADRKGGVGSGGDGRPGGGVVDDAASPEAAARWIEEHVGFVGTSVARMVPVISEELRKAQPLLVVADAYRPLPYDARAVRNAVPDLPELSPRDNFPAEVARKLFLYNMCHASLAYLGTERSFTWVHQTLETPDLRQIFVGAAGEVSRALEAEYPGEITREQNEAILADILVRYGNPLLEDTILRVGRDPGRKLSRNDRLVGAALLCERHGIHPDNVLRIIAAAFRYRDGSDAPGPADLLAERGPAATVSEVCGVAPEEPLHAAIVAAVGPAPVE
jgi:mannitol-1-phosphate 5-dehydrogenase